MAESRSRSWWRAVLLPPAGLRWALALVSLALVAWVAIRGQWGSAIAYVAYFASAVGLYYLITVTVIPLVRVARSGLMHIPIVRRYATDGTFNARVRLYRSAACNVAYALGKLGLGIYLRSIWTVAVAAYYLVLTGIRLGLVREDRKQASEQLQWRAYVRCGWELLAVDAALSGIVYLAVKGESFSYPGVSIFAMAAFAFYRVSMAVVRMGFRREGKTPLLLAADVVDMSVAVVALFALQTAMFASFSPELDVQLPNILLGTAVALVVTGNALAMVVHGRRHLLGELD